MPTLREKIQNHQFVTAVEIDPPKGIHTEQAEQNITLARPFADALNIADCPMAHLRMNPICFAALEMQKYAVEPIVHMTCRDHSVMGLESLLLGAHALGIRNILALTGDHKPEGKDRESIFEIDSLSLLRMGKSLNSGQTADGQALDGHTDFFMGTTATPGNPDIDAEIERLRQKKEAGAQFVETQPVYDIRTAERFLKSTKEIDLPVLFGVMPLAGPKMAKYMNSKVPGISIPPDIMEEIKKGGHAAGIRQARQLIKELKDLGAAGIVFMPSEKHMDDIEAILK